jgi:hypothetical protein
MWRLWISQCIWTGWDWFRLQSRMTAQWRTEKPVEEKESVSNRNCDVQKKTVSRQETQFGTWEHMLLPPENTFSKRHKIPKKNLTRTSRYSMCTRQVSRKTDISWILCKKDEEKCECKAFLALNFVFLHTTQKMSFFSWNNFVSTKNVVIYASFVGIFDILNFV